MTKRSVLIRVQVIIEAIDGCGEALDGRDFAAYSKSYVSRKVIERCVEIISEASKHSPDEFKVQFPKTPWRSIWDVGNILRHEYGRADDRGIWRLASKSLPELESVVSHSGSIPTRFRRLRTPRINP
jgi:uncharacterized protein with HEPN domain